MSTARVVGAFYDRIWNDGDLEAAWVLLKPDFRFRGSLGAELRGIPPLLEYVRSVRDALADYRCDILDCVSECDPKLLATIARTLPGLWNISRKQLGAVRTPVLAINGENDRENMESARQMAGIVPGLEIVEVPDADHRTSPRLSVGAILAFLNRHRK